MNTYVRDNFQETAPGQFTTLGDLITRTSAATMRLGIGSDKKVLVADSASTGGMKWELPLSSGGPTVMQRASTSFDWGGGTATTYNVNWPTAFSSLLGTIHSVRAFSGGNPERSLYVVDASNTTKASGTVYIETGNTTAINITIESWGWGA